MYMNNKEAHDPKLNTIVTIVIATDGPMFTSKPFACVSLLTDESISQAMTEIICNNALTNIHIVITKY